MLTSWESGRVPEGYEVVSDEFIGMEECRVGRQATRRDYRWTASDCAAMALVLCLLLEPVRIAPAAGVGDERRHLRVSHRNAV